MQSLFWVVTLLLPRYEMGLDSFSLCNFRSEPDQRVCRRA